MGRTGRHARAALVAALLLAHAGAHAQGTQVQVAGDAVVFRGRIDGPSAARFAEALQAPGIRRVVIDSPGGLVAPALDMAEAIAARGLDVEVPDECLSSCANYIFPAGRHKVIGYAQAVGWHGNMTHVLHLAQTGQAQWGEEEMRGAYELAQREQAFYARLGVDGFVCWFGKIAPYEAPGFYSLDAADMGRFGITNVTVQDAARVDDAPQLLRVDAARIEAERPKVRLAP